jgi:DmsE family decaheme c-type cytochrome
MFLLSLVAGLPLLVIAALFFVTVASEGDEDRVGGDTCEICHDELTSAFKSTVHWKEDPEGSCENCHGPGAAHVEEGDPTHIRALDRDGPAKQLNSTCLECHGRDEAHAGFPQGPHALGGITCTACHDPHESVTRPLLRAATPELCYECHATVRAQFSLNEHHPVNQGGIACQDCHDPHRRPDRSLLGGLKQQRCLRCHTEYRGPWFFEHEAVTVEGCTSCHTPHGSVNRHLLTYQRVGDLCLQCHPEQPFFHDLTDSAGQRTTDVNDCTRCHSEIHGSNNDVLFLN